jgi:PAS domain S-box-containing protein
MSNVSIPDPTTDVNQTAVHESGGGDSEAHATLSLDEARQMLSELRTHQIEIEKQNRELRRAQAELETALARYFDLYDLAPVGYFTLSDNGLIIEANLTAAALFGVARGELVRQPLSRFIVPDDHGVHHAHYQQVLATGVPQTCEVRMLRADEPFWARLDGIASQDERGSPVCHIVASDITDHKQVQEALEQSKAKYELERRFRAILDQTFEFIGLLAPDGAVIDVNRSSLRLAGVELDTVLGRPFWETPWWTHSPELQDKLRDAVQAAAAGEFVRFEATHPSVLDGSLRNIDFSLKPVVDEDGKIVFLVPEGRDVTDRKRAEEAFLRARDWERTFNAVSDAIAILGPDFRIVQANRLMGELLGEPPEALVGRRCCEIIHGLSEPPDFCPHKRMMASGKEEILELEIDSLNGVFEIRASPLRDELGQIVGCIHIARDVTAARRSDEARQQSEKLYSVLFTESADGVCLADVATGEILDCNPALAKLVGKPREELIGQRQAVLHPPAEDGEALSPEFRRFLDSPAGQVTEAQVVRPDGEKRDVEITGSRFHLQDRLVAQGVFRNVTERKRAEADLALRDLRTQVLLELHQLFAASEEELLDFALAASRRITRSEVSWVGFLDEAEEVLSIYRWSKEAMVQCSLGDEPRIFKIADGALWADCVRKKQPVLVNDYSAPHPSKKGIPSGHAPIRRFLAVPVSDGTRIVAVAAVANKRDDYDEADVAALAALTNKLWEMLRRKKDEGARAETLRYQQGLIAVDECLLKSSPMTEKLHFVAESTARLFDADLCRIWLARPGDLCEHACKHAQAPEGPDACHDREVCLHLVASTGRCASIDMARHQRIPYGSRKIGSVAAALDMKFLTNDVANETTVYDRHWARQLGFTAFAAYRLQSASGAPLGVLAVFSKHSLSAQQDALLQSISNVTALSVQIHEAEEGMRRELAERQRIEAGLAESNRQLEEATAKATELAEKAQAASVAKGQFLANVSHELRTPLNAIIGFSEGLIERADVHPLNEHQKDRLGKIKVSGEYLLHLINGILDVSKAESGKMDLLITPFAVAPIVWEVGDLTQVLLKDSPHVQFSVDMPEGLPEVTSDRGKLRQILINLAANAVKYTYAGSIRLIVRCDEASVVFRLEDTGIGVSAEHIEHLFEPFFQARKHARHSPGSTGLGLAISKSLVALLGGTLTVESALGQGSTFTVTIPLVYENAAAKDANEPPQDQELVAAGSQQEIAPC